MRVVVVNHMHPSVPHVSGMRAGYFARELAARGHQVVLLCEWTDHVQRAPDAAGLPQHVNAHDWRQPLVLAISPVSVPVLERVRSPATPALLRKALVVWSYVRHSGMFNDFSRAADPYLIQLAAAFKPQVVWGIFGNTDCWLISQRLAHLAGCGWAGDMKDSWDSFLPFGLRTLMARRFGDMKATTANSEFSAGALRQWFPARPEVVYSGVDAAWISEPASPPGGFRMMLVGGIYDHRNLVRLISGIVAWLLERTVTERDRICFCYAGSDAAAVESAVGALRGLVRVDVRDHIPLVELACLCQGAAVNLYLWSSRGFHHKLVELLCCRRPMISFPGEHVESVQLAREVGGSLNVCHDERQVQEVLSQVWSGGLQPTGTADRLERLTWAARAVRLETVLHEAGSEEPPCVR